MNNHLFDADGFTRRDILALLKRQSDGLTEKEIAEEIGLTVAQTKIHLNALAANQKCDRRGKRYRLIPTSHTEERLGKRLAIAAESPIPRTKLLLPPKELEKEKPKRGRPKGGYPNDRSE